MNHWIIVPVVLPAILAGLTVLAMRGDLVLQRVFGLGGTVALGGVALALLVAADANPPEVYRLGDWPAPFGIVLVLDRLAALMLTLTAFLALCVQLYVIGTGWDKRGRHFHALFGFQLMGLNGAFLTGDVFNLFVFFEVLLIASYGLMIHGGGRERLRAGVQYVTFNLVASTLFLFGLATIYSVTGTLNMADLAIKAATLPEGEAALLRVAGLLLLIVFGIKAALVPFHFWLPGTYANAPGPVAALFAIMTKVGAYSILRVFTLILPPSTPATGALYADILLPVALVTLAVGALGVLGARTVGRMVAFAAVASMGTLFVAVSQFTPAATTAALYYVLHSTLATAALFLIADLILARRGDLSLAEARPAFAGSGLIAWLFLGATVALAGMPPLSGFLGKLMILEVARDQMALVWSVILVTSLLMIVGFAQAGSTVFWKSHALPADHREADTAALPFVSVGLLLAAIVALTVLAGPVMGYLSATSASMWDPGPYIAAHALPEG